jgi:hypothetical protein
MPEWYLINFGLAFLATLGFLWPPLFAALLLLLVTVGVPLLYVINSVVRLKFSDGRLSSSGRLKFRLITAFLHIVQPLARLYGRLRYGLVPWRWRGTYHFAFPKTQTWTIWSEKWQASESRLQALESALKHVGAIVCRGGDYDNWDLEVIAGLFGKVRVRTVIIPRVGY